MNTRKTVEMPAEILEAGLPDKFLRFYGLALLNPGASPREIAQKLEITDKYAQRIERALLDAEFLAIEQRIDKTGTTRRYVFPHLTPSYARAS